MHDEKTVSYFDQNTPKWSIGRFRKAVKFINETASEGDSIIDIGCGSGNILHYIRENTPITTVVGMDPSPNYVQQTEDNVGCEAFVGSILDPSVMAPYADRFDYAVTGDVIHHLVGNTRPKSKEYARQAIVNSLSVLKKGGHFLIAEPVFTPAWMVSSIFYVKVFFTRFTTARIGLSGSKEWMNIGAPVVSFYDPKIMVEIIDTIPNARLVKTEITKQKTLAGFVKHARMTLVIEKI